ncbi:tetraacyldisaccharide 4'-kinase [Pirellulaceae bacterium SH467]
MIPRLRATIANNSNSLSDISIRAALWCASQPYAAAIWLRNLSFDRGIQKSQRVGVPVISVGNLTAGGTGKTPTVAWLAQWFRDRAVRVAILSRGYGAGPDGINDEAKELELRLRDVPHLQSPDRVASAKIAVEELDMQILLLDDGFQHRRIHRDLEIVLLDAREPFGYGHLLPRGLLREPLRSLKRADIVIATRSDQVDAQRLASIRTKVQRYNPKAAWLESRHRPLRLRNSQGAILDVDWLRDKRVVVVSGIGSPEAFHQTTESLGAILAGKITFPDHHLYHEGDIREIASRASDAGDCDVILCTGKDLAKIAVPAIESVPVWSLDVDLEITSGLEIFEDHLKEIIRQINYPLK